MRRPNALPISLAIVSLPAAVIAVRSRRAPVRWHTCRGDDCRDAATPVLAMAFPAPRRPPRSSAMLRSDLRRKPTRDATDARTNVSEQQHQPCQPAPIQIDRPDDGAADRPGVETVRARRPSHATRRLTPAASGSAASPRRAMRSNEVLAHQRQRPTASPPAAAGTVTLSSSRIGIVSASAATPAATTGAASENQRDGGIATAGRHHQASSAPAAAPEQQNASEPATVLSGFHGNPAAADLGADEGGHAVARRHDAPRRGDDVEAVAEEQGERQDSDGIEKDARMHPAHDLAGRNTSSADARQHEHVESERGGRQERGFPPGDASGAAAPRPPSAM